VSRYRSCTWKPLANRSTRALQKDILCWHTMVSTSMAGTWGYFNTGAGGRGVYSHGLLGGGWGTDLRDGLDGECWQAQDTDLRAASNLDGNWHVIAFETADNAARPIQPWTPKQCAKIVEVCVEANQVDGIPLQIIPDSRIGRRGIAYHRLGCDPYRVSGGELWSSAYGKDCPTDPRIKQLPALVDQARRIVAGQPEEDDVTPDEVKAAVRDVLHLPDSGLAVPGGQTDNGKARADARRQHRPHLQRGQRGEGRGRRGEGRHLGAGRRRGEDPRQAGRTAGRRRSAGVANPSGGRVAEGFDVSGNSGDVDFAAARRAGLEYCYLRVGRGKPASGTDIGGMDLRFGSYAADAQAAGLQVGGYWRFFPSVNLDRQVNAFAARLEAAPRWTCRRWWTWKTRTASTRSPSPTGRCRR
jgi:hypothetical protein